jgi:hypothetical protein
VPAWLAFIKDSRNRRFYSENEQYENQHAIRAPSGLHNDFIRVRGVFPQCWQAKLSYTGWLVSQTDAIRYATREGGDCPAGRPASAAAVSPDEYRSAAGCRRAAGEVEPGKRRNRGAMQWIAWMLRSGTSGQAVRLLSAGGTGNARWRGLSDSDSTCG